MNNKPMSHCEKPTPGGWGMCYKKTYRKASHEKKDGSHQQRFLSHTGISLRVHVHCTQKNTKLVK